MLLPSLARLRALCRRPQTLGERGERLAARELRRDGYRIVARNWRGRTGEIDVIVRRGSTVAFVEVKTRVAGASADAGLDAREAVHPGKQRQIARAAAEWWQRHSRDGWSLRFDVVAVVIDGDDVTIEHIEAAFESPL